MKNIALILASGIGERSGLDQPKQFFEVGGKTLLERSIDAFESHPEINEIIIVAHPDYIEHTKKIVKHHKVISGGSTRQESSYNGIFSINEVNETNILIHDAVRAFITHDIITACLEGLNIYPAVCVATEASDTILEVDNTGKILNVPNRKTLRVAQTPQCFKLDLIRQAHKLARVQNIAVTDDCGLILANNLADIYIVEGAPINKKITYPEDLKFAQWFFGSEKFSR